MIISKGSQPQTRQITTANDDVFRLTFIIMAQDAKTTIPHFLDIFFSTLLPTLTSSLFPRRTLIVSDSRQLNCKRFYVYRDSHTPNYLSVGDKQPLSNWDTTT